LLVAAAGQPRRRDRRPLGHAHDLEGENALQRQIRSDGDRRHGPFAHVLSPRALLPTARGPRAGRHDSAELYQFFSIRMTCGLPEITRSRPTAASALRTASSVVAYVMRITGTGSPQLPATSPPCGRSPRCRCTIDSREMFCCASRLAMAAAVPGLSTARSRM